MHNKIQDTVPLYATQGGGIAAFMDGQYVWHELPDWVEALPEGDPDKLKLGDPIPQEWDIQPINESAREEMFDEVPWEAHEWPWPRDDEERSTSCL